MKVGICDDVPVFVEWVERILREHCRQKDDEITIFKFEKGEDVLLCPEKFDLVFLDIEMPGKNGMEVAKQLRERADGDSLFIVFLTAYKKPIQQAFLLDAHRYIMKTDGDEMVIEAYESCKQKLKSRKYVIVQKGKEKIPIFLHHIIYVKSEGKGTKIYDRQQNEYTHGEMISKWERKYKKSGFFRCHRSYLVNLAEVREESLKCDREIRLSNGEILPLAKRKKEVFEETFMKFLCQEMQNSGLTLKFGLPSDL